VVGVRYIVSTAAAEAIRRQLADEAAPPDTDEADRMRW
jgi:hypothetical protein